MADHKTHILGYEYDDFGNRKDVEAMFKSNHLILARRKNNDFVKLSVNAQRKLYFLLKERFQKRKVLKCPYCSEIIGKYEKMED